MTLRPKYPCRIIKSISSYDRFGRPQFRQQRIKTRCDVVYIREGSETTTVREDSSASRGRSEEYYSDARLMLHAREQLRVGDLIEVDAYGELFEKLTLEVMRIQRRVDVHGRMHHMEVDCNRMAIESDEVTR